MGTGTVTPEAPVDGDVEPIDAVFARLAVDVEELSIEGCDQWAVDALRLDGWLKVRGLRVEQVRRERVFASWVEPGDGQTDEPDPNEDRPVDADPGTGGAGEPDANAAPTDDSAGSGEPSPSPVDAPGRQSRRQQARARNLARALALLPSFKAKLEQGELTEDHVLAVNAIRNRDNARGQEPKILAAALARTAEGFATWINGWDTEIDSERHGDLSARQHAARRLQLFDGSNQFRGTLTPAVFDAFTRTLQAIDAELSRDRDRGEPVTYDQRMADALIEMMHRARGTSSGSSEGSLRTAVVVLIDIHDLLGGTGHGITPNGSVVDVGEVRRMAATGHVIPLVLGAESVPLDMGRAQRYANDQQWLALLARDGGCVLCDAPLGTLDAHHVPHWNNGGRTDLCTMCLCCTDCHRRIHADKITLTFTDGRIRATARDGTPVPTHHRRNRRATPARGSAPPGTTDVT